VSETDYCLNLP